MPKIWWLPIESLPERYSAQWNVWFKQEFTRLGIDHQMIYGDILTDEIREGCFLDVTGTNYFKASQLQMLCQCFEDKEIKEGDIIFFHDLWFPGLEMLAYIRDALGINFKIYGILHAGTWDEWDFLTQKGMGQWAEPLEHSWFRIVDGIFVATHFHKNLILRNRPMSTLDSKIHVTGLSIYPDFVDKNVHKENIIVFPHRLDIEKQPEMFDKMAKELRNWDFGWNIVKTKDLCKTKQEYYNLLNTAKISVSCALQETWGIAMIESVMCGCIPIVPDRLSYYELYPGICKYDGTLQGLIKKIREITTYYESIANSKNFKSLKCFFTSFGGKAIKKMVNIMLGEKWKFAHIK